MNSIRRICSSLAGPPRRAGQPATMAKASRRRPMIAPRLLPRTVQLCMHCRHTPAGFWVSDKNSKTVIPSTFAHEVGQESGPLRDRSPDYARGLRPELAT